MAKKATQKSKKIKSIIKWTLSIIGGVGGIFGIASFICGKDQGTAIIRIEEKVETINNIDCSHLEDWRALDKTIELQKEYDNIKFIYKENNDGGSIEFNNSTFLDGPKEFMFEILPSNLIENDLFSFLLKDEKGKLFARIEFSKKNINVYNLDAKTNEFILNSSSYYYGKTISQSPLYHIKIIANKEYNNLHLTIYPQHKNSYNENDDFIIEKNFDINITQPYINNCSGLRIGLGVYTSLEHNIDLELRKCNIQK